MIFDSLKCSALIFRGYLQLKPVLCTLASSLRTFVDTVDGITQSFLPTARQSAHQILEILKRAGIKEFIAGGKGLELCFVWLVFHCISD